MVSIGESCAGGTVSAHDGDIDEVLRSGCSRVAVAILLYSYPVPLLPPTSKYCALDSRARRINAEHHVYHADRNSGMGPLP
jgi:hypothetical protein